MSGEHRVRGRQMSSDDVKIKPPIMLPDDGPRFHEERESGASVRSTSRPYDDWNPLQCPDCRKLWLTDEALCHHWNEQHDVGQWSAER